jgi:hypothetical protein
MSEGSTPPLLAHKPREKWGTQGRDSSTANGLCASAQSPFLAQDDNSEEKRREKVKIPTLSLQSAQRQGWGNPVRVDFEFIGPGVSGRAAGCGPGRLLIFRILPARCGSAGGRLPAGRVLLSVLRAAWRMRMQFAEKTTVEKARMVAQRTRAAADGSKLRLKRERGHPIRVR